MRSIEKLMSAGFTNRQAEAILDVIVEAQKPGVNQPTALAQGSGPELLNTVDSVTTAISDILAAMDPERRAGCEEFLGSLQVNVRKYKSLTPKQFAALQKFYDNMQ